MTVLSDYELEVAAEIGIDLDVTENKTLVDRWINRGRRKVARDLRWTTDDPAVTGDGSGKDALPADVLLVLDVAVGPRPLEQTSVGRIKRLQQVEGAVVGDVALFAVEGKWLYTYPQLGNGDDAIVTAVVAPTDLTDGAPNEADLPEDLVELVVFAALTRAGARWTSQATANGTSYIQQYQLALADARSWLNRRKGRLGGKAVVGPPTQNLPISPSRYP